MQSPLDHRANQEGHPVPGINLTRDEAATRADLLTVDGYEISPRAHR